MKQILLLVFLFPLFLNAQTVTVFTDDFGSGCDADNPVTSYTPPSGTWTVTETGTNYSTANIWYVSAAENGNNAGECGSGCGNDRTLHIGSDPSVMGDIGAAYFEGLASFCNLFGCGATDKRVESPVLDCTGLSNIVLEFLYIEGGNTIDNATLWYYDGSAWSQIANMPKTVGACSPQGTWTLYNITLPVSAENNPNVKIGFRWINNDNGVASDPSIAVDDILVTGESTITDITPPVIICPPGVVIGCGPLADFTGTVSATDDTDPSPVITQLPAPGTIITGGPIPLTFFATDNAGNTSSCMPSVTFSDLIPPSISCPSNITIQVGQGSADVQIPLASLGTPIAGDNCSFPTITNDHPSDMYPVGTTFITWTATDGAGNESQCVQTITVSEDQSPVITCPDMATYSCVALPDFTTDAIVTDDNDASPTVEQSPAPGTIITEDIFVTLTATDDVGNSSTCTFMIMYLDDEDPSITCPADIEVVGNINGEATITSLELGVALATDNCSSAIISNDHPSETFTSGNTSVTWTAMDAHGNMSTCIQTVNVLMDEPPVIICPGSNMSDATPANCQPNWDPAIYFGFGCTDDNIDQVIISDVFGNVIMSNLNTGCNGNPSGYIEYAPVDGVTSCNIYPGNFYQINVAMSPGFMEYYAGWLDLNNDGDFEDYSEFLGNSIAMTPEHTFGIAIPNDIIYGPHRLRLIANFFGPLQSDDYCIGDVYGEGEDYLINVQPPISNVTCGLIPDCRHLAFVTDDFDPAPVVTQSPAPNTPFFANTEVTLTATDNAGNESSCTFMIYYGDITDPEITCPSDVSFNTDLGDCSATVTAEMLGMPLVADNCGVDYVENNLQPSPMPVGISEVSWVVYDMFGNSASCIQSVTMNDLVAPELICPEPLSITIPEGELNGNVSVDLPSVIENCTNYTLTNDFNGGADASGNYELGITDVTFMGMDDSGNMSTCTTTVEVSVQEVICCLGDFNCDGYISVLDLIILMAEFGCQSGCTTSLDGNSAVTTADVQIFMGLYGTICP